MSATYRALEDIAARSREQSESLARPARIRFFVDVLGAGETRLTGRAALQFGAFMMEEPTLTWGVANGARNIIPAGQIPYCSAVVLGYQTTADGKFFSGAEMGFLVESGDPNIRLKFSLTFEGVTLRTTAPMSNRMR